METERFGHFKFGNLGEKEKRNITLFGLIKNKGPISRTEISNISGINTVSVSHYIKTFLDKKFVLEKGFDISSGGRKPELLELNGETNRVIGIRIGDKDIDVKAMGLSGAILAKERGSGPFTSAEEAAEIAAAAIDAAMKRSHSASAVRAIGVGVPDKRFFSVAGLLEKRLGIASFTADHAFCAAFAEKELGFFSGAKNLLYIHTDLGRGIIIKEDIILKAAEIDGSAEPRDERELLQEPGLSHALEYLRPWGEYHSVAAAARSEASRGVGTLMVNLAGGKVENICPHIVIEAAGRNDRLALDLIKNAATNLGIRIAYLVNMFFSEAVVMGGELESGKDKIVSPVKDIVMKFVSNRLSGRIKIATGTLGEDAVSLGAGMLAIRELFLRA